MTRHQALASIRENSQLLAGICHDLNNGIAGVLGYCRLLAHEGDAERRSEYTVYIRSQAESCAEALDNLQFLSSPISFRGVPWELSDLVGGLAALDTVAPQFANITVDYEMAGPSCRVIADIELLRRAFLALLQNAREAIQRHGGEGSIQVLVTSTAEAVVITITDTGGGLAPHLDSESAFSPTSTYRKRGTGVGLGLPVALAVAQAHGGDAWVSASDENGMTICVSLAL